MKRIIIIIVIFVLSLGAIDLWGPNIAAISLLCISAFLAGLFIGQRKHA